MSAGKNKHKKLKKNQIKLLFYGLCGLLVILVFMFGCYLFKSFSPSKYVIESRVDNLNSIKEDDIDSLKTVGWLRVQGTNIDYPVIYAPGFNLNLITDDFAWTEADYKNLNNIIYISGHNIKNLSKNPLITDEKHSRFEQLMSFTYYDFAKDNQYIQYTFNGVDYVYKIFSVSYVDFYETDVYNKDSYSKEKLINYIHKAKELSLYNYGVDVNENDSIIALDTCTKMFGSGSSMHLRVVGRLLRKGESTTNNKISTTSKYKEIEDVMKGGDSYEEA